MALKIRGNDLGLRTKAQFGRIGVLMGGFSTEREISLKSGRAVYESLKQSGVEVAAIDIVSDDIEENIRLIKSHKIDCAFLALHGSFGEDGRIQEILENLNIPYTGPGVFASRLAMNKVTSRKIFEIHGLIVPIYEVLNKFSYNMNWRLDNRFKLPVVVKPANHGSSIGLSFVAKKEDFDKAVDLAFSFDQVILVEEYIKGREITVGIVDEQALPIIEIIPKNIFFDYEAKYKSGMTEYIVPAKLEKKAARNIQDTAIQAYRLLGCVGCSRVDMILTKEHIPVILEVNTIPGFTETSLLPKAAKVIGVEFSNLCLKLIELAYEKTKDKFTAFSQTKIEVSG